jgi:hypothetical protein
MHGPYNITFKNCYNPLLLHVINNGFAFCELFTVLQINTYILWYTTLCVISTLLRRFGETYPVC